MASPVWPGSFDGEKRDSQSELNFDVFGRIFTVVVGELCYNIAQ